MYNYSSDAPARGSGDDRFQRWPFAQRIAQIIATRKSPESIVIGINGAWGEGKTTVFYFIEEELSKHENVVSFRFNPWRFPDETKLIRDFFQSLAVALEKNIVTKREKIGDAIGKYISIPAAFVGAGDATKAMGDLLSSVELEKLKERVEAILKDAEKRVVVLMDDIDRLDKAEIQTVFRLVKLVADFDNTAYVLAFDSEMVASALQDRYSTHDKEAGRNFLEKIIQVPLDLPHISKNSLRMYCLEIVQEAINEAEIELTDNDVERFILCFDIGLMPRLHTPRMAKRYGNILSFALPILRGEVNPVDLILIEGIRAFYPKLYDAIRDHPEHFIAKSRFGGDPRAADKRAQDIVDRALADLSEAEKLAAIGLIKRMFPRMEHIFGGVSYDNSFERHWASKRLIASDEYFQRYFSYAIPAGQLGDGQIKAFVDGVADRSPEDAAAGLGAMVRRDNAEFVISKLRLIAESIGSEAARSLALVIAKHGELYPNPRGMFPFMGPFSQAAMLVSDLVARVALLEGIGKASSLAEEAIQSAEPLDFALEIFSWVRFENDEGNAEEQDRRDRTIRKPLPLEHRPRLGLVAVGRIKEILHTDHVLSSKQLVRYLSAWATFTSRAESSEYVQQQIASNPSIANWILDGLRPVGWEVESGLSRKSSFERGEYENLRKFVDPQIIWDTLELLYGQYEQTEMIPRDYLEESEKLVADQFRWMHKYVQNAETAAGTRDSEDEPNSEI